MSPLPNNFKDALSVAKQILGQSSRLTIEGRVETEAEQLLVAVYRSVTGIALSRIELFLQMGSKEDGSGSFPKSAAETLIHLAQARIRGIPLQYLVGFQWFRDHEYEVSPAVLVPRPETEVLLDVAIKELAHASISPRLGLEIGLGSGVLSIELLSHFPELRVIGSELTDAATTVARRNADKILGSGPAGADRLTLIQPESAEEVLEVFERFWIPSETRMQVDFILSNPPYLAGEAEVDPDVLSYEPHEALFAPKSDSLYFYKKIIEKGRQFLSPFGFVFVELPHERSGLILKLFLKTGWFAKVLPDLTGRDRVLVARLVPLETFING